MVRSRKRESSMMIGKKNWPILIVLLSICIVIRLFPFHIPNIEPILAFQLPITKKLGQLGGFFFAILAILIFDFTTSNFGVWSLVTATTYGVLSFAFRIFHKKNIISYTYNAIIGTLIFDGITGLCIGPILFHQPFMQALIGQIPFTAIHIAGNTVLAILLSPAIESWLIDNKENEKVGSKVNIKRDVLL
jgi:hypothetical protein